LDEREARQRRQHRAGAARAPLLGQGSGERAHAVAGEEGELAQAREGREAQARRA
jgi:hypothetical protein